MPGHRLASWTVFLSMHRRDPGMTLEKAFLAEPALPELLRWR
ncbi:hypothetical protein OH492_05670 [Vibrio chagasii]|nr:hypothetical protein [Vibrio chagasii]